MGLKIILSNLLYIHSKPMRLIYLCFIAFFLPVLSSFAQSKQADTYTLLKPDRVFDGQQVHNGWWVLVKGNRLEAVGEPKAITAPSTTKIIELKGETLMPGMIE